MGELINRTELIKAINEVIEEYEEDLELPSIFIALGLINEQAAVDAVPVIRCEDCRHWCEEIGWCDIHSHFVNSNGDACHPWESSDWKAFRKDDYCSEGERGERA